MFGRFTPEIFDFLKQNTDRRSIEKVDRKAINSMKIRTAISMEVSCISGYKDLVLIRKIAPLYPKELKIVEVNPLKTKEASKNFQFNIWPVLSIDGHPSFYGISAIINYLFNGSQVISLASLPMIDSALTVCQEIYRAAAPMVAASQSIIVKKEVIEASKLKLTQSLALIEHIAAEQNLLIKAIIEGTLDVVASIGVEIPNHKADASLSEFTSSLVEEAVKFAITDLGIPERYSMSPAPTKPMYFSTPIYYVNGVPHIGHVFTTTLVETLSAWYKLRGINCIYSSGTDEHGMKVQTTAAANGIAPQEWCDKTSNAFRTAFEGFDIHPDVFIRTTEARHEKVATRFWNILLEKGYIYKGTYEGWYSKREEAFIPENQVKEVEVNGEKKHINEEDGAELFWSSETNWMFKLSAMQQPLLKWYEENPTCITPRCYYNQIVQMVKSGLNDISVSRQNVTWGIPVPNDPSQTMYVWIDALTNYLTVAGWGPEGDGIWPCDVHTVGKDIVKFHAIYWPAFLIAAGVAPYKRLLVHGWWTRNDEKMSKSLGNTLDPIALRDFWGLEPVKYFLLREATLVSDSDYSAVAMLNRYNNDLADVFANLVLRFLSPKLLDDMKLPQYGEFTDAERNLIEMTEYLPGTIDHFISFGMTRAALTAIWDVFREMNKYVTVQKPWAIKKTDAARCNTVLYVLIECVRLIMVCLVPFMPQTAKTVLDAMGASDLSDKEKIFKFGFLKPGTQLRTVPVLFPKKTITAEEPAK